MTYQLFRMHVAFTIQKLIMSFRFFFFFAIGGKSLSEHQPQLDSNTKTLLKLFNDSWVKIVLKYFTALIHWIHTKNWSLNRLIHLHNNIVKNDFFLTYKHFNRRRRAKAHKNFPSSDERINCELSRKINKTQP